MVCTATISLSGTSGCHTGSGIEARSAPTAMVAISVTIRHGILLQKLVDKGHLISTGSAGNKVVGAAHTESPSEFVNEVEIDALVISDSGIEVIDELTAVLQWVKQHNQKSVTDPTVVNIQNLYRINTTMVMEPVSRKSI